MHRLVFWGSVLLIGLAFFVALVVVVNLPHSWAGILYVIALLGVGAAGLRASAKLRRKAEERAARFPIPK